MGSVKLRAIGNESGQIWDHKGRTEIVQIILSGGSGGINSLQFQYLEKGRLCLSEIVGKFNGEMFNTMTFEGPDEYITRVEGAYGGTISKLCIHTNKKQCTIFEDLLPLGRPNQRFCFNFSTKDQFGGFYGTKAVNRVTSIGVYFNHLSALPKGYRTTLS